MLDRLFLDCVTSKVKKLDVCGEIDSAISKLDKITSHKKAFDADITNKEAIRLEWNRNNMSNRIAKTEL